MNYGLQIITPATDSPLSVEEVARYLRADLDAEYPDVEALIGQAVEEVERYTGRSVLSTGYRLTLRDWPRGLPEFASYPRNVKGAYIRTLELPRSPVTAIAAVRYYPKGSDTLTVLPSGQYIAVVAYEPGMVYLKEDYEWPEVAERPDAVQVEFTAGYSAGALPKNTKQAMLLLCRYYYAGGSPNERDENADDLAKAHLILDKHRISGWSA